jgi:integrase
MTSAQAAPAGDPAPLPGPGTLVLGSRPLRPGTQRESLSVFADDRWNLFPAVFEENSTALSVSFARVPEQLRLQVKHVAWNLLNYDGDQVIRYGRLTRQQPSVRTTAAIITHLRAFTLWMQGRGIGCFADVTAADLDLYAEHVNASELRVGTAETLLQAVRWCWTRRLVLPADARLPEAPPWSGEAVSDLVGRRPSPVANLTPRIHPEVMEPLLLWSLRFVEDFSDDIIAAFAEYKRLCNRSWRAQRHGLNQLPAREHKRIARDLAALLRFLRASDLPLPGLRQSDGSTVVHYSHLSRLINCGPASLMNRHHKAVIAASGLQVAEDAYLHYDATGQLEGRSWADHPISYNEAPVLARHLQTACFVITAYLSGARPGEVLALRRGCTTRDEVQDLWLMTGKHAKGVVDADGNKKAEGELRADPWVVVEPVARAAAALERLHSSPLLFPATLMVNGVTGQLGQRAQSARSDAQTSRDIRRLVDWVNAYCAARGRRDVIPPDRHGRALAPSRFRRTLAWYIVRKPRGLVAAAIQYGHVQTRVTLGYSGTYDSGFPDELSFEQWLHHADQLTEAEQRLADGEHVSGPASAAYKQRVRTGAPQYAGRVLRTTREARDLLGNPDIQVVRGEGMTCVPDRQRALCRLRTDEDSTRFTPDLSDCRPRCPNIARTDADIAEIGQEVIRLREVTADPLAPAIRHQRETAELNRLEAIIASHEKTRPA